VLLKKCYGEPVAVPKVSKYMQDANINWGNVFKIAQMPIDVRTRDYQYRFLNDILVNNYWLYKWKLRDDNLCTFCKSSVENIVHMFWECEFVFKFWTDLQNEFRDVEINLDLNSVLLGSQQDIVRTMIFTGKKYISECRFKEQIPTLPNYLIKIDFVRKLEFQIAKNCNKVSIWQSKWEPLSHIW